MKKLFIKYNPYKLETKIMVNGEEIFHPNSLLREKATSGSRLQEWVEELPRLLVEEYASREWEITFHGTLLDYQDLKEVFDSCNRKGELTTTISHTPAKETSDKIGFIDEVFKEIQKGPFDELKDEEIGSAFQHAKSSQFEVCVVATMSAGKSTLINAMLGTKLMPSKCEACTAIITRIIDNDNQSWKAKVYGQGKRLLETHEELTYEKMVRLNEDKEVSVIEVNGDIPFVDSKNISLVLIDTPGPNNSRDPEHKKVQSEFLSKSSKSLVLYIMEGTFGSNDDNQLLKRVADSMAVAGKQSKDRFIFVVNKMDNRKNGEDVSTDKALNNIRQYLQGHGINNPNLFPVAALPALNIKLISNGTELDVDTREETEFKVKKLNRNEQLHLESYATLPLSIKNEIARQLYEAEGTKDDTDQALIHTGIVSLEAAIRQYVEKYAETAKIKNIVDTFIHKLEEVGCFEETKRKLSENRDQNEKILAQIKVISKKLDDVKSAQNFKTDVHTAVDQFDKKSRDTIYDIHLKFQNLLTQKLDEIRGKELSLEEIDEKEHQLNELVQNLQPEFYTSLNEVIRENLIETSNALLDVYRKKLTHLIEEMDSEVFSDITIDPLKLIGGSVICINDDINRLIRTKKVENGEEWIENTDKKWFKPWTWFDEDGYYRTIYKDVRFVKGEDIAQLYLTQIQNNLLDNAKKAYVHAVKESEKIEKSYNKEFKRLDELLKKKLAELERFTTEKEQAEERIQECESKLEWLEQIKNKVESILEI